MNERPERDKELSVLKGAVENTNEAFVTIDEKHKVLFFNRAAEKIFGYSRDEVIGRDLDMIMAPGCSQGHHAAVERYVQTRVPRRIGHGAEIPAKRKNGDTFPAHISFSVSEVGGKLYFTGIVRDLTETKALQERLAKSQRLADLGRFVAEITHEIKNPLMMIGGFAHQLVQKTEDSQVVNKLQIIEKEVARLENLLRELGAYYQPKPLTIVETDINALLRDIHLLLRDDCRKKNIRSEIDTEGGALIIRADKAKLEQVLLNLAKNAIESIEEDGKLTIRSRLKEDKVEVTVTDNGCGIPPEDQEKIFSPFYTTKRDGSGLGLSISRRIIEEHEGSTFTLKSEQGKGTEFKITMPVVK